MSARASAKRCTHTPFWALFQGAPASVRIYMCGALGAPTSMRTFFKADRVTIKWDASGNRALVLAQTEVDATGQSYFGETNLHFMDANGQFDCRVTLDKEGPIHDLAWSPNGKEFVVVYGCTRYFTPICPSIALIINH